MPLAQIALISQTPQLTFAKTAQISAALQKQVMSDFAPIWNVHATVDAFATVQDMPDGSWPILIRDDIDTNASGIHSDRNNQPFALVEYNFDINLTSLFCSHECLEMLADPFGSRFITSDSIKSDQGRVNYLLEVCDPCQHPANGYPVNNFLVSDFYTPNYFDPVAAPGVRYSFRNRIDGPKQVLPGGYVSWQLPDQSWWQGKFPDEGFVIVPRGKLNRPPLQSWREVIDQNTKEPLYKVEATLAHDGEHNKYSDKDGASSLTKSKSRDWTKYLCKDIDKVIAKSKTSPKTVKAKKQSI